MHYFEGYLAKLADVRKRERKKETTVQCGVVACDIHRKVFLKRTNYKTEQVERREKEIEREGNNGKERQKEEKKKRNAETIERRTKKIKKKKRGNCNMWTNPNVIKCLNFC